MFSYKISESLLRNIKDITSTVTELNLRILPKPVLAEFEQQAVVTSSHSSTSIEGNPLPITEVRQILKNRPAKLRESEREVINYYDTLLWINEKLKATPIEFNTQLILKIHKKTMAGLLPKFHLGQIRKEPVFVNSPKTRKTIYWPPDHQDAPELMEELIRFIRGNKNKIDPLILAGIFHKQFVIIHPFLDGNGRTVRLATKVLLANLGINVIHLFSFENYYNKNASKYFENVGVRGNYYDLIHDLDFTSWLEYFSEGILDELQRVKKQLSEKTLDIGHVLNEDQEKVLSYIQKHGFIRDVDYLAPANKSKVQTLFSI